MTALRSAYLQAEAGSSAYSANAVNFDGTNDYLTRAGLVGVTNSKLFTFSCWIKIAVDGAINQILYGFSSSGNIGFFISKRSTNLIRIQAEDTSGTVRLTVETAVDSVLAATGWIHILVSFDMSGGTLRRWIYLNDVYAVDSFSTFTNSILDFTHSTPGWFIGSDPNTNFKWNGDVADLWFAPGQYINISDSANRRLFIDAAGKPVDLGMDGSTPTGTAPAIFLKNPVATWQNNLGTGGNFTENGALTAAASSPSD